MAFTKINAAGIGSTETVTVDGLTVINDGSFGGNLTVAGVLTYEDVTNVDSVGLITARNGIVVGSGITLSKDGDIFATGITTVSGNVKVGTGITLSPDGDGFYTGVVTATTFKGDGSQLTGVNSDVVDDTSPQLGGNLASNGNNILMADNDQIRLGNSQDLQIYHNGTESIIYDVGTGNLKLRTDSFRLRNAADTEHIIKAVEDGAVELYFNTVKKFETTSSGVTVTGDLVPEANDTRALGTGSLQWAQSNIRELKLYESSIHYDNVKANFGHGEDLQIYHDGSNSYISEVGTGNLQIQSANAIEIESDTGEKCARFHPEGEVQLYFDNSVKFATASSGVTISGNILADTANTRDIGSSSVPFNDAFLNGITMLNSKKIALGNSADLQIYHNGNSIIGHNGAGHFFIETTGSGEDLYLQANDDVRIRTAANENAIICNKDGAVELYFNNVKQINTHPNGIFIRGIYPMSDNSFDIGSSGERFKRVYATNGSIQTSDRNQKNTIMESDLGLDFVNKLKPISYKWNEDDGKTHYGLIAQDVEETLLDTGKTASDFGAVSKEDDSPMGLSYNEFISPLVKAIQELTAKNDALEARIKTLEG